MINKTYIPAGPLQIRDGTYDRIKSIPGFANVFKARTKPLVLNDQDILEDGQLPCAVVFFRGSRGVPLDGVGNTGAPQLIHSMSMSIQIIVSAGDEEHLDINAHQFTEHVQHRLLRDNSWHDLFESLEEFNVSIDYPKEGELYLVISEINIEVTYRSIWNPITPHDFKGVNLHFPEHNSNHDNFVQTIEIHP